MTRRPINPHAPEWLAVQEFVSEQLQKARREIEARSLDPVKTEYLRGRIAALREVQELGAEKDRAPVIGSPPIE